MASQDQEAELGRLRSELAALRSQLETIGASPSQLHQQLADAESKLSESKDRNDKLVSTLREARDQLVALREEVDRLAQPPNGYAQVVQINEDDSVDIMQQGRKLRVNYAPTLDKAELLPGREVVLNEAMCIVSTADYEDVGELVTLKEFLSDDRVLVVGRSDEERVVRMAGCLDRSKMRVGHALTVDQRSGFVYEVVPRSEVEELVLEEVPEIDYSDIGGLSSQIDAIKDAVELPFMHPELFREHGLRPPKGILLYGPPGCGKTLIAKAVAHSLSQRVAEKSGNAESKSYFLNVKGPELLNKFVGETERHIRLIFGRAREKASQGSPVVVFFDEMESLFRTRGSGVSSDTETTIVPQLLAEIDGVERLENVIMIGASNREDMIDPAILRPGRLDVKIKIKRPDAEAAIDIFSRYLTTDVPLHDDDLAEHGGDKEATVTAMIQRVVETMYANTTENEFLEVTYANGDKEILYYKDFNSGAMIQNIVDRAKKSAIKDFLDHKQRGIRMEHLLSACVDEFKENEDLPNTTNPDDWARISGKKGEKIVYIRTLIKNKQGSEPGRSIDNVATTGQYL